VDDGHLIIKFFLHISKGEQRRRFDKLSKDALTAWQVTVEDWEHHRRYDDWLRAYEEAFEHTETEWGPWTIVEATDRRYTGVKIYQTILQALETRLGVPHQPLPGRPDDGRPDDGVMMTGCRICCKRMARMFGRRMTMAKKMHSIMTNSANSRQSHRGRMLSTVDLP
jgi:hypothetical protein